MRIKHIDFVFIAIMCFLFMTAFTIMAISTGCRDSEIAMLPKAKSFEVVDKQGTTYNMVYDDKSRSYVAYVKTVIIKSIAPVSVQTTTKSETIALKPGDTAKLSHDVKVVQPVKLVPPPTKQTPAKPVVKMDKPDRFKKHWYYLWLN